MVMMMMMMMMMMMIVVSCHKIWYTPVSFSIVELLFPQKVYFARAE